VGEKADLAHANGQGRELVINLRRYPNIDALFEHLASVVKHGPVRKVVTPTGNHRVTKVTAFKDGRVRKRGAGWWSKARGRLAIQERLHDDNGDKDNDDEDNDDDNDDDDDDED
jgi:hypothetical protein